MIIANYAERKEFNETIETMNIAPIVSKVWSFCTALRDDGVNYGDYLEQIAKSPDETHRGYDADRALPIHLYSFYVNRRREFNLALGVRPLSS